MEQINGEEFKGKGALDVFLNLLNLITLGWASIWLGRVLFWIINNFFSPQFIANGGSSTLKLGIASLIIVVPAFLVLISYLHRQYRLKNLNSQSVIHRVLTYFMLLISALMLMGDLVTLIFKLLNGDYTLAFFLKVIVVLIIAGGIFGYYFYDLRRKDYSQKSAMSKFFMIGVIVIVVASIGGSIFLVDSPQIARLKNFDLQRTNDLTQLNDLIQGYYQDQGKLPADLTGYQFKDIKDPQTNSPYDYKVKGTIDYELCATFDFPADTKGRQFFGPVDNEWFYHQAGNQCFAKKIISSNIPTPLKQ